MNHLPDETSTAYDRVGYPSHPFGETHPGHLATLGALFGMEPAPLSSCRVLELGCGEGANLIPMAFQWPGGEFVGIDLSEHSVRKGNAFIAQSELKNISLHHCDIMAVTPQFGWFDYIIAHGVYSWVPAAVRTKMFAIFHDNLAPQGIAFVSYNCYPGCHSRDIARQLMRYHVRHLADPRERVQEARSLLKFVAENSAEDSIYGCQLRDQQARVQDIDDEVLYHDDLSEVASPFVLHQVAEEGARQGLQYMSDAAFPLSQLSRLSAPVRERLAALPADDAVGREQYMDFIDGRAFRESLFCHDAIALRRDIRPERVARYHISTSAAPSDSGFDPAADGIATFTTENGSTLKTDHRLSKAAIQVLGASWPEAVSFPSLVERALSALGAAAADVKDNLAEEVEALSSLLLRAFSVGQMEFHLYPACLTATVSERPRASPLARRQAQAGAVITNLRHRSVSMKDETVRRFILLVDGTRTVDQLVADLQAELKRASGDGAVPDVARQDVEQNLGLLAKLALLVA